MRSALLLTVAERKAMKKEMLTCQKYFQQQTQQTMANIENQFINDHLYSQIDEIEKCGTCPVYLALKNANSSMFRK